MSVTSPIARKRVLILGSSGFLGSNIALVAGSNHTVVLHARRRSRVAGDFEVVHGDLLDDREASEVLDSSRPDLVVNCAALANVDACEANPELAGALNARLPGRLARMCAERGIEFVHVSTDAVFGDGDGPFRVDSETSPVNVYGHSKSAGERAVLAEHSAALVVRTNIVGWSPSGRRSLLEFFVNRLAAGESCPGFTDVFFRPISAMEVWPMVEAWMYGPGGPVSGIQHATGAELISKFEFGQRVARTFGYSMDRILPMSVNDGGLLATRTTNLDVEPSDWLCAGLPAERRLSLGQSLQVLRDAAESGWRNRVAALGPMDDEEPMTDGD